MMFDLFLIHLLVSVALAGYSVSKAPDYDATTTLVSQPPGADGCLVSVPDYITEEIEPPAWLGSWDAASFYATDCSEHILELPEDTTVEYAAKMYVYSYTKNHNVTDWIEYLEENPSTYQMLDKYWETGDCGDQHETPVPTVDPKDSAASCFRPAFWVSWLALLIV